MFVLISGSLWRDPVTRQSKAGKQFVTALLKAGTPSDPQFVNVCVFDQLAQSELLRLTAGDAVSVQGTGCISVFQDKNGEHRASLDLTASHVLALRQPKKPRAPEKATPELNFDDGFEGLESF
jgi:single-stranded DNA-binding protein